MSASKPAASILQRKILLKRQAIKVIRVEMEDLRFLQDLLRYRDQLTRRIGNRFDRELSARLDWIQTLLDSFSRQPLGGPCGGTPIIPAPAFSQSGGVDERRLDKIISKNLG